VVRCGEMQACINRPATEGSHALAAVGVARVKEAIVNKVVTRVTRVLLDDPVQIQSSRARPRGSGGFSRSRRAQSGDRTIDRWSVNRSRSRPRRHATFRHHVTPSSPLRSIEDHRVSMMRRPSRTSSPELSNGCSVKCPASLAAASHHGGESRPAVSVKAGWERRLCRPARKSSLDGR